MKYEPVDSITQKLIDEVRSEVFPELLNANILSVFVTKKKVSKGKLVFASVKKADDLIRYISMDKCEIDIILSIDQLLWNNIEDIDKIRIIRRTLRQLDIDIESENNPYKIINFEISDFYEELDFNKNEPKWYEKLEISLESLYEDQKQQSKEVK